MAKKQDKTRTQPLTLAALREYGELDSFSPPGSFDPRGQWKNIYRIWLVGRKSSGFLSIEGKPSSDNIVLNVQMSVLQAAGTVHQAKAKLQCADDALSTPQSWEIESQILNSNLRPIERTKVKETVTVKGGRITVTAGDNSLTRKVSIPFTSNWSLFDAVQRLPGQDTSLPEFSLLEDLDLPKEQQRLSYWQSTSFDAGENTLRLTGYQQIGRGVLPYQYWVDDQNRLLFAISGIRAYIFDSNAQKDLEQRLRQLARRKR